MKAVISSIVEILNKDYFKSNKIIIKKIFDFENYYYYYIIAFS